MATPEQKIKKDIKDFIDSKGGYWAVITGGPFSKPGDPDIVCFFPDDGRFIGIEAKTPTGVQSPIQKARQEEIESKGGIYLLVRSLNDLIGQLEGIGIIYGDENHGKMVSARTYSQFREKIIVDVIDGVIDGRIDRFSNRSQSKNDA